MRRTAIVIVLVTLGAILLLAAGNVRATSYILPAAAPTREWRMSVERLTAAHSRLLRMITCVMVVWEDGSSMLVDPDGSQPGRGDNGMSKACQDFIGLYVGTGQATKDIRLVTR